MLRYLIEIKSLYTDVRRPIIMIMIGATLTLPLGLATLTSSEDRATPEVTRTNATSAATAEERTAEPATPAEGDESPESDSTTEISRYARHFSIPFTLADQIHRAAREEGIDPGIAFGLVQTESSFRRTVISSAGAVGYTQLLPSTARWIAPGTTRSQLFNTQINLQVGFNYLKYLLEKYNGNVRLALTAYNRGPGTVDRLLRQGRNPENGYATKVLRSRA